MSNIFSTNFNKNSLATVSEIFVAKDDNKNLAFTTTLDKAELNVNYVIVSCKLPVRLQTRFEELGFVAGTNVTVTKKAPLGDPIEITIMGYSLCIRASEAKHVTIGRDGQ